MSLDLIDNQWVIGFGNITVATLNADYVSGEQANKFYDEPVKG